MAFRLLTVLFVSLFVMACVAGKEITGEEIKGDIKMPESFRYGGQSVKQQGKWWGVFTSPQLNSLMEQMFADNYKLAQSYEGMKALYASYGISVSDFSPVLSAKTQASGSLSETGAKTKTTDSYFMGLSASYEADIWGRLKNTSKAELYTVLSGRYDLDALYMSLSAEMASKFVTCVSLAGILEVKTDGLKLYEDRLKARERLYKAGIGDMTKVLEAKKSLETVQADIIATRQAYENAVQAVAVLLGRADSAQIKITEKKLNIPPLPAVLPSEVAMKRPDILSALYTVYKYDRAAAAAAARRYPSLTFTAEAGYTNDKLADILSPENFAAQIIGSLVLPLIDGKERRLEYEKQQAYLKKSIFAYQEAVITGLGEVQTALNASKYSSDTLELQKKRMDSDLKLYKLAKMRYEQGIDDYESVLETEITLNEREAAVISAGQNLALSRIDVITALGGSWTNAYTSERLDKAIENLSGENR